MNKLETICVTKLRIMRNITYSEKEMKCYNCSGEVKTCQDYREYDPGYQIPLRTGTLAFLLSYIRRER